MGGAVVAAVVGWVACGADVGGAAGAAVDEVFCVTVTFSSPGIDDNYNNNNNIYIP